MEGRRSSVHWEPASLKPKVAASCSLSWSMDASAGNGLVETQMHLYLNGSVAENLAPTAPSLLDSQVLGDNSVALWWNPASDDLTPAQALTYELRLYREGVPVSTARRLPEPGNLSVASEWTLAGLSEGNYTWTLEAVDSAYNPGPAAAAAFVIGNPPAPLFTSGFETGDATGWSVVLP